MQREAFNKLYSIAERVHLSDDRRIKQDWDYLQASNNFRFMTTKNSGIRLNSGIYESPYDAFTNYMNILGDFIKRVESLYPMDIDNEELNALLTTIKNQGDEIANYTKRWKSCRLNWKKKRLLRQRLKLLLPKLKLLLLQRKQLKRNLLRRKTQQPRRKLPI